MDQDQTLANLIGADTDVVCIVGKCWDYHVTEALQTSLEEGINMVKKHQKPNPQKNIQGGIIEKEALMDLSNLAILNPVSKKADRVGFKTLEDGKKVRIKEIERMWGIGTPEDLKYFLENYKA